MRPIDSIRILTRKSKIPMYPRIVSLHIISLDLDLFIREETCVPQKSGRLGHRRKTKRRTRHVALSQRGVRVCVPMMPHQMNGTLCRMKTVYWKLSNERQLTLCSLPIVFRNKSKFHVHILYYYFITLHSVGRSIYTVISCANFSSG